MAKRIKSFCRLSIRQSRRLHSCSVSVHQRPFAVVRHWSFLSAYVEMCLCPSVYCIAGKHVLLFERCLNYATSRLKTIQFKAAVLACPVIDCNSPPAVNGAYVEMQGNTTTYDAVAHYTCDNRLVFGAVPGQKTAEATCQENGNWSAVIDTCQGSTCNVVIVYFSNEF